MKKFVSNRNVTICSSKAACAIEFKKGEPIGVPPAMYEECLAAGILPVEGNAAEVAAEAAPSGVVLAPEDGAERAAKILKVIEQMVARNSSRDFTGAGHPNAQAVTAALGWKTDQKEVTDVWNKNKARILTQVNGL